MGIVNFEGFLIAALFFIMTPGIDTLFVLNKSITGGFKAGRYASLGVNIGVLIHSLIAAFGVSLLVAQSEILLLAIKYVGGIYIIFLGIKKLTATSPLLSNISDTQVLTGKNTFISGLVTNSLNPKVALFILAFFPQFILPEALSNPIPMLILGLTYASIGILWYVSLSLFASQFATKIVENPKMAKAINTIAGITFVFLGLQIIYA